MGYGYNQTTVLSLALAPEDGWLGIAAALAFATGGKGWSPVKASKLNASSGKNKTNFMGSRLVRGCLQLELRRSYSRIQVPSLNSPWSAKASKRERVVGLTLNQAKQMEGKEKQRILATIIFSTILLLQCSPIQTWHEPRALLHFFHASLLHQKAN